VRGCLFVLVLGAVVIALVVVIGLPAVAAGVLTAGVGAAGLQAPDTTVTVTSDPPTELLGFHADRVRVRATHATFRGFQIGALDVALSDVGILDRTAGAVDGRLTDVEVANVGARRLRLGSIQLSGGGDAITATTTIPGSQAEGLIADAVESALGIRPTTVMLAPPDRVTVQLGVTVDGRLRVTRGGDLVARMTSGPMAGQDVTLLHGGEDLPVRLTNVSVTPAGDLRLGGNLTVGLLG
jgi:hypothetical protein